MKKLVLLSILLTITAGCVVKEEKTKEEFLKEMIAHKMILCSAKNSEADEFFINMGGKKYKKTLKKVKNNLFENHDHKGVQVFYWISMRMSCKEIENFAAAGNEIAKKPKVMADQIVLCEAKGNRVKFIELMSTKIVKSQHKGLIKAFTKLKNNDLGKFNEFYEIISTGDCKKIKKKFLKKERKK